jgi:hypothetical protein
MEFMLILNQGVELVTEEQRRDAVRRVGEYAMGLMADGTLKGGSPLRPVSEDRRIPTRRHPFGACPLLSAPLVNAAAT